MASSLRELMGPSPEEVAALTRKLARRITRHVDAYREAHRCDIYNVVV